MLMYQRPLRSDELYHWGLWTPWKKKKPKYIAKIPDGDHIRYFYSQEELDAYRNADKKVNTQKKSVPANPFQSIKDYVDYKVTGFGYKRDAKRKNKEIDELSKIQKEHPLHSSREKLNEFNEREAEAEKLKEKDAKAIANRKSDLTRRSSSKVIDEYSQRSERIKKERSDYLKSVGERNRRLERTAEYAKQFNLDEAERNAENNSLFGKVTKFFKARSDRKVVDFMRENPDYAQQWLEDLGIKPKEFNPNRNKNPKKLKKILIERGVMKETDTLNDVLKDRGYAEKERGRMEYYKDSTKKKKKTIKHSDDELQSFLDTNSEELMHYGRLGMKWYQHIFGPVQSGAKYAQKAGQKIASAKAAHDAKAEAKWQTKKEKIIRSGDPAKVRKYQTRMTDDELRRADNRIAERNKLDKATGHEAKQAQNFVNQNANRTSVDLFKEFGNVANNISNTYNSFDKIMTTIDSAKKYTPEAQARAKYVKDAIKNRDTDAFEAHPEWFGDNDTNNLVSAVNAGNRIANYIENERRGEEAQRKAIERASQFIGPYMESDADDMKKLWDDLQKDIYRDKLTIETGKKK